jgi:hypothetical protein
MLRKSTFPGSFFCSYDDTTRCFVPFTTMPTKRNIYLFKENATVVNTRSVLVTIITFPFFPLFPSRPRAARASALNTRPPRHRPRYLNHSPDAEAARLAPTVDANTNYKNTDVSIGRELTRPAVDLLTTGGSDSTFSLHSLVVKCTTKLHKMLYNTAVERSTQH